MSYFAPAMCSVIDCIPFVFEVCAEANWSARTAGYNWSTFMSHRSNLDILRAFAVLTVVAHHLILTLHTQTGIMSEGTRHFVTALGHSGVLAFLFTPAWCSCTRWSECTGRVERSPSPSTSGASFAFTRCPLRRF